MTFEKVLRVLRIDGKHPMPIGDGWLFNRKKLKCKGSGLHGPLTTISERGYPLFGKIYVKETAIMLLWLAASRKLSQPVQQKYLPTD